jgi:hypothetical protein
LVYLRQESVVKRVQSGILALLAICGGCASNEQRGAGTLAPPPEFAPQKGQAQRPTAAEPVRQPMADETRATEEASGRIAKTGDVGRYYPVAAAEIPAAHIVARVNGQAITLGDLQRPLIEGYGLRVLLFQIQLNLARQQAIEQKVTYTRADIDAELERTLKAGFQDAAREDYPALLAQLLERQGASRAEFDMGIEIKTILRKIAEPQLKDKITDDNLMEMFNAVYGESAVIKHVQCSNALEAQQAKVRLAAGEKWEDIVRTMSRNVRTAALDGELPPFSRQTVNWGSGWGKVPEGFKAWAFGGVKVGDISDPIQADGSYHILKLERRIQPKVVKFEDVKDGLRAELYQKLLDQGVAELRNQLLGMMKRAMVIEDPTLRRQYESKIAEQEKSIKEEDRIRSELKSRIKAATQESGPATRPVTTQPAATQPAPAPPQGAPAPAKPGSASPANAPPGEQPPAPKSGPAPDQTNKAK